MSENGPPSNAVPNGKDSLGRFTSGNRFGKGSGIVRRRHAYRQALESVVGPEQLKKLFWVMYEKGLDGDTVAARLVLEYLLGKPLQPVEVVDDDRPLFDADEQRERLRRLYAAAAGEECNPGLDESSPHQDAGEDLLASVDEQHH